MTEITQVCPACGRRFAFSCHPDEWGYAYGKRLTCSYSCMRAMEREAKIRKDMQRFSASQGNRAQLYRQYARGATYDEIAQTGTAKNCGWTTPERVKAVLLSWVNHHPAEAREIRIDALYEQAGTSRAALAAEMHIGKTTVGEWARRLGVVGRKCGKSIYYSREEADRIRQGIA